MEDVLQVKLKHNMIFQLIEDANYVTEMKIGINFQIIETSKQRVKIIIIIDTYLVIINFYHVSV